MTYPRFSISGLIFAVTFILAACSSNKGIHTAHFDTESGQIDITIIDVATHDAKAAIDALAADIRFMQLAWGTQAGGALAHANEGLASGKGFSVPPSLLPLIDRARQLEIASAGLLNPALGGLKKLWRLDVNALEFRPPEATEVTSLLDARPSLDHIEIQDYQMRSSNPAVALDFGTFIRGYVIDQAVRRLREFGIENAMVNTGSGLHAIGSRSGHPWHVSVRRPDGTGVFATLDLEGDESLYSVGTYEHYQNWKGTRYHHLIDPRTGQPGRNTRAVTVIHPEATLAQAAATALFLAGPRNWPEIAARMGVNQVLLVDADGRVHMTPAMQSRLQFLGSLPTAIISDPVVVASNGAS